MAFFCYRPARPYGFFLLPAFTPAWLFSATDPRARMAFFCILDPRARMAFLLILDPRARTAFFLLPASALAVSCYNVR